MSRHCAPARYGHREVTVVAGYDRPLNDLFLQVFSREEEGAATEGCLLYSSMHESHRDWTDIDAVASKLAELGIEVPATLLEAVYLDQLLGVGNRIAWHDNKQQRQQA